MSAPHILDEAVPASTLLLRSQFPSLSDGLIFFDSPGGSQVPLCVANAVRDAMIAPLSNRGDITESEKASDHIVLEFRQAVADLIDCDARAVVYGRSWTQLTYDFSRALAKTWRSGDEVIVSRLDHDSNIRPWIQAAESVGAVVKWIEFDINTSEITLQHVESLLSDRTVLVTLTGASNLVGTRPDIKAISSLVHNNKFSNSRVKMFVDGVQLTPHTLVSFKEIGADFYGFSFYKLFGPHCSVVVSTHEILSTLHIDNIRSSTTAIPERFELGTLPYEIMSGCIATVDFIASLATTLRPKSVDIHPIASTSEHGINSNKVMDTETCAEGVQEVVATSGGKADIVNASSSALEDSSVSSQSRRDKIVQSMKVLEEHEQEMLSYLDVRLKSIPTIKLYGHAKHRTPTVFFSFVGIESSLVYSLLAAKRINVPAHCFNAIEAVLALGLTEEGALRIGLAPYNTYEEIDHFINVVTEIVARMGK